MSPPRAAKCGRCRIDTVVGIGMREGRGRYHGVMRCGLAWSCPVCRSSIQAERATDVLAAVEWQRARRGEAYLLTLTIRHGLGHDLKAMRKGVANAWRKVQAGRRWVEWKERIGLVGTVRALETTHGSAHGWHPHIHVLILAKKASARDIESWRAQLSAWWQVAVTNTLGAAHVPNDRRGCDLRKSRKSDYLTKLGLEVAGSEAKDGRAGNRSPMEIAEHFTTTGDVDSAILWRRYTEDMHGARMLTWSKGLRAKVGLGRERTDEEIIADDSAVTFVVLMPPAVWDALSRVPGGPLRVLEAAERDGAEGAQRAYNQLLRGRAPPWVLGWHLTE